MLSISRQALRSKVNQEGQLPRLTHANHFCRDGSNKSNTKHIWNRLARCGTNSQEVPPRSQRTKDLKGKLKRKRKSKKKIRRRKGSRRSKRAKVSVSSFVSKPRKDARGR